MFNMMFDIQVGKYRLALLHSAEVHKSVDLLADTCSIVLPGTAYSQALRIEEQIKRGDAVTVKFGYDDISSAKPEFEGFLQNISTDGGSITLTCEDGIFLTRKAVGDTVFSSVEIKEIAEYVCSETGSGLTVVCDYGFRYDRFTVNSATGFDVLKKLQDETKANIYVKGGELHMHPAYIENFGHVKYDFSKNIEKSDLHYRSAEDRKYRVDVEGIDADGRRVTVTAGTAGGDRRSVKIYGVSDVEMLKRRGEEELKYLVFTGYEGSITAWLIPYVEPGYSATVRDAEYEYKDGTYYVVAVTTTFDENGGVRKIELGRKLS
jgi:hypothetical protein